jgi:hypothetical protein
MVTGFPQPPWSSRCTRKRVARAPLDDLHGAGKVACVAESHEGVPMVRHQYPGEQVAALPCICRCEHLGHHGCGRAVQEDRRSAMADGCHQVDMTRQRDSPSTKCSLSALGCVHPAIVAACRRQRHRRSPRARLEKPSVAAKAAPTREPFFGGIARSAAHNTRLEEPSVAAKATPTREPFFGGIARSAAHNTRQNTALR